SHATHEESCPGRPDFFAAQGDQGCQPNAQARASADLEDATRACQLRQGCKRRALRTACASYGGGNGSARGHATEEWRTFARRSSVGASRRQACVTLDEALL